MPLRSLISNLPEPIKAELDQRLHQSNFSNYEGLAAWLQAQGFEISKSSIHRYGSKLEERMEMLKLSTQGALQMKSVLGDDDAVVAEMSLQLAQGLIFDLMVERGQDLEAKEIGMITRALADASRAGVGVKKFQAEVKAKAEAAATETAEILKSQGISEETAAEIRRKFLGIAA